MGRVAAGRAGRHVLAEDLQYLAVRGAQAVDHHPAIVFQWGADPVPTAVRRQKVAPLMVEPERPAGDLLRLGADGDRAGRLHARPAVVVTAATWPITELAAALEHRPLRVACGNRDAVGAALHARL